MYVNKDRKLIMHYHLFKNAGTSVDFVLKKNFKDQWVEQEFEGQATKKGNSNLVEGWIRRNPEVTALSSHTALMPLPDIERTQILPIIFVRHPITRLLSAYNFERKQVSDTYGAVLAKKTDFSGYLTGRMNKPHDTFCENFQAQRFAFALPEDRQNLQERALATLAALPFVGVVEIFDPSMMILERVLKPHFPNYVSFSVRENVTDSKRLDLNKKLQLIKDEIGTELYQRLQAENMADIILFEEASKRVWKEYANLQTDQRRLQTMQD